MVGECYCCKCELALRLVRAQAFGAARSLGGSAFSAKLFHLTRAATSGERNKGDLLIVLAGFLPSSHVLPLCARSRLFFLSSLTGCIASQQNATTEPGAAGRHRFLGAGRQRCLTCAPSWINLRLLYTAVHNTYSLFYFFLYRYAETSPFFGGGWRRVQFEGVSLGVSRVCQ